MADTMAKDETAHESRTLVERLARYLAARDTDASGQSPDWIDHIEASASLLALMKDPDAEMAQAGDAEVWRRMIDAALVSRWSLAESLAGRQGEAPGGGDEEGDMAIGEDAPGIDKSASWVQHGSERSEHR